MNFVPHRYRNLINPHQTKREIRGQVRFAETMCRGLDLATRPRVTRENEPDRWPVEKEAER